MIKTIAIEFVQAQQAGLVSGEVNTILGDVTPGSVSPTQPPAETKSIGRPAMTRWWPDPDEGHGYLQTNGNGIFTLASRE